MSTGNYQIGGTEITGLSIRMGSIIRGAGSRTGLDILGSLLANLLRMFADGTINGALYDPSNISSLNQLSIGTTPVTVVTDPVGLVLDSRFGLALGAELVVNGGPFVDTTGWANRNSSVLSVVSSEMVVTNAGATYGGAGRSFETVIGKTYTCYVTMRRGTCATVYLNIGSSLYGAELGTTNTTSATNVTLRLVVVATTTTTYIGLLNGNTNNGTGIYNIASIKLLEGNHALQATAAARPTWEVDGNGKYYLSLLGIDDSLTSATGGGGDAGFFWCGVVEPTGGAGANRNLFDDRGTNTGYLILLSTTNKLDFWAGNGTSYTMHGTAATVNVGTKYLLTVWDDGINLNVQINSAVVESAARPVVVAGTAGYTIGKTNGVASNFFIGNLYPSVYAKNTSLTAAQRASVQAWVRSKAGL